ncbi:NAD(P)/FAD-dependent oxidoreductase [uncultured Anaerococcus sp.]|uniref:NAD(P)/FAD-dependent oxidoreductase n=1 Tax=uncultured Anaerococcus sp. TaxID=293428 RepID=UPI0025E60D33|nr:NAD(P)/FAD-dependent oxidoreductase [uncultured Anaerococcus sp.]
MKKIGIIGAGASGLYAAINLKNQNTDVTILEKNDRIGKKILMTGNGRCNITNAKFYDEFLENIVTNQKFLYSSFSQHDNYASMDFFQSKGLELVTEEYDRVFPKSQKSTDVIRFFEREIIKNNIKLITNTEVLSIKKFEKFLVKTDKKNYDFDYLIIATGGLSYPNTGATGDGYKFAKNFGHKITKIIPSLVPIFFKDKDLENIKALSLENIEIKAETNKGDFSQLGPVLLTKNFISGPSVLRLSSFIVGTDVRQISLNLSVLDENELDKTLIEIFDKNPNKDISNVLDNIVPNALSPVIIKRAHINPDKKSNQITKDERSRIVKNIKNFTLDFDKFGGFNTAVITKGGVDVRDIDPKTMESKLVFDLYFVGEVLDIDALTGGFNLQIAFTSAFAASSAIKEKI